MKSRFESEIRGALIGVLNSTLATALDPKRIHLPAREAHASVRPPQGTDCEALLLLDYGMLYGAPLVKSVRCVNGWLLFDFSPAFFSALVGEINATIPEPDTFGETHAENRMRVLARHDGSGCPDLPALQNALIVAITAHESPAVYRRAAANAQSLFHAIPPRDRLALVSQCGALGGALWRLLAVAR